MCWKKINEISAKIAAPICGVTVFLVVLINISLIRVREMGVTMPLNFIYLVIGLVLLKVSLSDYRLAGIERTLEEMQKRKGGKL